MAKKTNQTTKTPISTMGIGNTSVNSICQLVISLLGQNGFLGLEPIGQLMANNCVNIPKKQGIYLILRSNLNPPSILQTQLSINYYNILRAQKSSTLSSQMIRNRWVKDCYILSIGYGSDLKASGRLFTDFGNGNTAHTCAGKYIWTLDDCLELLFCWIPLPDVCDPKNTKGWLLQEFNKHYGSNPFAVG